MPEVKTPVLTEVKKMLKILGIIKLKKYCNILN